MPTPIGFCCRTTSVDCLPQVGAFLLPWYKLWINMDYFPPAVKNVSLIWWNVFSCNNGSDRKVHKFGSNYNICTYFCEHCHTGTWALGPSVCARVLLWLVYFSFIQIDYKIRRIRSFLWFFQIFKIKLFL